MANKYLDLAGLQKLVTKIKELIPTRTSELNNDKGFITIEDIPGGETKITIRHQERFIVGASSVFELTKGYYTLNANSVNWYLDGIKQSNDTLVEINNRTIEVVGGLPEGSTVVFDYVEYTNTVIGLNGKDGLTTAVKLGSTQYNHTGGVVSLPAYPTALPADGGDADTVNGKTVGTNVPAGAVFTDTVYSHPTTHSISEVSGLQTTLDGKVDDSQVLTNVPTGAKFTDTVYSHPATHSADMITDGTTNKAYTATEKTKLSGIDTNANNYSHPTTAGNKHIPTGGASGQILRYSASGTAIWGADNDTITTVNGKTGTITKADITALGIPAQDTVVDISGKADKTYVDDKVKTDVPVGAKFTDTVYAHPASHPASMITGLPASLPASGGNADTVGGFTVGVNVPAGAKFTDTVTTINGKTGAISKADITALGVPAQDTNTTYSAGAGLTLTGTVFTPTFGTTAGTVTQGNDARLSNARTPVAHTHTKSQITDMPTKLSQLTNDIGAGAGLVIITSATEPTLNTGDQWHKEI